jgi:hypothetical protein
MATFDEGCIHGNDRSEANPRVGYLVSEEAITKYAQDVER